MTRGLTLPRPPDPLGLWALKVKSYSMIIWLVRNLLSETGCPKETGMNTQVP